MMKVTDKLYRIIPIQLGSGPVPAVNLLSPEDYVEDPPGAHKCPEYVDSLQHVHHVCHIPVMGIGAI